jgi:ankyrin repeat protein
MQKEFDEYCNKGNIVEIVRIYNENKNIDVYDSFYNACCKGNLQIADILYQLDNDIIKSNDITLLEKFFNIFYDSNYLYSSYDYLFLEVCRNEKIDVLNWLYSIEKPNINAIYDAFIYACGSGNLNIAKWLCNLNEHICNQLFYWIFNYDIILNCSDEAFNRACYNGHLDIVQWLYSLDDKPDIHLNDEEPFRSACISGNLNLVKWLYNLDNNIDIHANDDEAFRFACECGHLDIAQWLYSLDGKIDIHAHDDHAFKYACELNNIDIAKWLETLSDEYEIEIIDDKISRWDIY